MIAVITPFLLLADLLITNGVVYHNSNKFHQRLSVCQCFQEESSRSQYAHNLSINESLINDNDTIIPTSCY